MKRKKKSLKSKIKEIPLHLLLAGAVCMILAVATVFAFAIPQKTVKGEFIPPEFDSAAIVGTPEVPEKLVYQEIWQDGMHFSAWVCCAPVQEDGKALVYFTNPTDNDVWMKLRILDGKGNTVGESGLLRPGEYVESILLTDRVSAGETIKLKIMTYEPENYFSMGSVGISTVMGE